MTTGTRSLSRIAWGRRRTGSRYSFRFQVASRVDGSRWRVVVQSRACGRGVACISRLSDRHPMSLPWLPRDRRPARAIRPALAPRKTRRRASRVAGVVTQAGERVWRLRARGLRAEVDQIAMQSVSHMAGESRITTAPPGLRNYWRSTCLQRPRRCGDRLDRSALSGIAYADVHDSRAPSGRRGKARSCCRRS